MTDNDSAAEKRIVTQLDFSKKTAKRVGWERFEFTIAGPHQVEVTNASYGFEKADHSYLVGVEERDGVPVPAECECPADVHLDPDCKHKVALATIGGQTVLDAAVKFDKPARPLSKSDPDGVETGSASLQTDGGVSIDKAGETAVSGDTTGAGPRYTYHYEPAHVGGERYVRCERCGAECIPAKPEKMLHREGCSEGER